MIGSISVTGPDNALRIVYIEKSYRNGKLDETTTFVCRLSEAEKG
jgi:hypothetical protein